MDSFFKDVLSARQLSVLSSMVQVGNATYNDLCRANEDIMLHPYMSNVRGRIKTRLVQMQAELEHSDPQFPFQFSNKRMPFGQIIPQLSTEKVILHLAHGDSWDTLPSKANYKCKLSYYNDRIQRQLRIEGYTRPSSKFAPLYGIMVFGFDDSGDAIIQFPEPGYTGIADYIPVPKIIVVRNTEEETKFERKKTELKAEFLRRIKNE